MVSHIGNLPNLTLSASKSLWIVRDWLDDEKKKEKKRRKLLNLALCGLPLSQVAQAKALPSQPPTARVARVNHPPDASS